MSEKKIVKGVVQTFSYYDAGSDYFFEGAIVVDKNSPNGFNHKTFREYDYEIEYVSASDEEKQRWADFQNKQHQSFKSWNKVFKRFKDSDVCPVCGSEKYYLVRNEWMYKQFGKPKRLAFCLDCKCNVIWDQSQLGGYWIDVCYKMNSIARLKGDIKSNCVKRYLEDPLTEYIQPLQEFEDAIHSFLEKRAGDSDE